MRLLFFFLLFSALAAADFGSTNSIFSFIPSNASINATALSFSSNPITEGNSFDVYLTLQNNGGMSALSYPTVFLYSENTLLDVIVFDASVIGSSSGVVFAKSYNTALSPGNYTLIGNASFDDGGTNYSTNSITNYLIVNPASVGGQPSGGNSGGDFITTPDVPKQLPDKIIPSKNEGFEITSALVLKELIAGVPSVESIKIKNTGFDAGEYSFELKGLSDNWFVLSPEKSILLPGEERSVNVLFKVPEFALPGDYLLKIIVNGKESGFTVLRVKKKLSVPVVSRKIIVDTKNSETIVVLELNNFGGSIPSLSLKDILPKQVSSLNPQVSFIDLPGEIDSSRQLNWVVKDLQAGEIRTISYKLKAVLEDYADYSDWTVQQLVVQKTASLEEVVRVDDLHLPISKPGQEIQVQTRIFYSGLDSVNARIYFELPESFILTPNQASLDLLPRGISSASFGVKIPENAEGSYSATLVVETSLGVVRRNSVLIVSPSTQGIDSGFLLYGAAGVVLLVVGWFGFNSLKNKLDSSKNKKERKPFLEHLKNALKK
ncbi:hypothetical protein HUU53_03910 [Candidatus Micrarchaeota archaeon]|nr:hypothetical protein [Candidatus Micrarchaeota archaeon]